MLGRLFLLLLLLLDYLLFYYYLSQLERMQRYTVRVSLAFEHKPDRYSYIVSALTVLGSVFMRRFRLFFGTVWTLCQDW